MGGDIGFGGRRCLGVSMLLILGRLRKGLEVLRSGLKRYELGMGTLGFDV